MSSSIDFERAKAYFQQCNNQGQTLYDHLASLILQLSKQPTHAITADPLAAFHNLSVAIKQSHVSQHHLTDLPLSTPLPAYQAKLLDAVNKNSQLVSAAYAPTAASQAFSARMPDMLALAPLLEAAGVSLEREILFTINSVLHTTASYYGLNNLNFWGIIHGTEADYYILEHQLPATQPTLPKTVKTKAALATLSRDEPPSHGINAYQYYVSNSLTALPFTALPHARAELLTASRDHHRLFTGRLTAAVTGHPHFDGVERDMLRCVIARISHAGFVVVKGSRRVEERSEEAGGGEDVVEEEAWEGAVGEEVKEAAGWVHARGKILKKGRVTPYVPPEVEPEEEKEEDADKPAEEEEEPAEEEEEEEAIPALNGLDADEPPTATVPTILIRSSLPPSHPHTITTATPTLWPGAINVASHKQSVSVYVGYGVKYRGGAVGGWKRAAMGVMKGEWTEKVGEDGEQVEGEAEMKEQDDVLPEVEKDEEEKEGGDEEEAEEDEEGEEEEDS